MLKLIWAQIYLVVYHPDETQSGFLQGKRG